MQLGQLVRDRRENMGMSLSVLSREMGGSPGASFLSRIEGAQVDVSAAAAVRLAQALALPREVLLNAAGFATTGQIDTAMNQLGHLVGSPAPVMAPLAVIDPADPDRATGQVRSRMMRHKEDAFIIDLSGAENEPYVGEAIVSRERKPKEGQAVVAIVGDKAGAWTWHTSRPTGDYLSRTGDKAAKFKVLGVIVRVVSELNLDPEG